MPFDLDHALRYLIASEGSDLHLKIPSPPLVRLHGELQPIPGTEPLSPQDTMDAVQEMLHDPNKLAEFEAENEVDFSYSMEGLARFRVNAFFQRGTVSVVMRAIPVNIKSVEELNLPSVISRLAEEERGIILLTGTTGSGKSTTLAAMIDHMNRTMHKHIVTIEDPIEFLHPDRNSIVNQREVGQDTASFKRALRRVLRQDPDVILVGEMRDEETVQTALSAAETGHLHDMILDPKLTGQLPEVIAEGAYYGMQTFDQHLLSHLQAGRITFEDALHVATSPHDFKLMVAAQENPTTETAPAPAPQGAMPPSAPPAPSAAPAPSAPPAA